MKYLLDTNVCIDLLRSHPVVVERASMVGPSDCAISSISSYELRTGALNSANPTKEMKRVELLVKTIRELVFDRETAATAAQVRVSTQKKGQPIGPYDILIAAQALQAGLILVTNNIREFKRVPGLEIEDWRKAVSG